MSAPPSRWAKLALIAFALVIAGGVCTLRINSLQTSRDEALDAAAEALSRASRSAGEEQSAAFREAEEAATEATRVSSVLMDPYPSFVLQACQELRAASDADEPGDAALPEERAPWLAVHGRLAEALDLVRDALDALSAGDLRRERLTLWLRLLEALAKHA